MTSELIIALLALIIISIVGLKDEGIVPKLALACGSCGILCAAFLITKYLASIIH